MSQAILSKETKTNLEVLKNAGLLEDFYLAGGTGPALQLKHRLSLDLDFFSSKDVNTQALIQKIKDLGKFFLEREAENTLTGNFNGTRVSFLKYDYPLLFSLKEMEGIKVADVRDIGSMKIAAISSRGTKRDFIDLFFICQKELSLKKLIALFKKKYKDVNYNTVHLLKNLVYFEDAKKEPMPKMIETVLWEEVEGFFEKEVKELK